MRKKYRRKQFTLIELIIVIVVIGILTGMALPKFIGVQRNANLSKMFRDIDTLEKSISMFCLKNPEIENKEEVNIDILPDTLKDILQETGELYEDIYIIDKDNLKEEIQTLGFKNDTYIVTSSLNVYSLEGKKNGEGLLYHTYDYYSNLYKKIYIDNQKVTDNSIVKVNKNKPMLRGILNSNEVNFYLDNENITKDINIEEKENQYEFNYSISLLNDEIKDFKIEDRKTRETFEFKVQNSKEVNFALNEWGLIDASDYNDISMKENITNTYSNEIKLSGITDAQIQTLTNKNLSDPISIGSVILDGDLENRVIRITTRGFAVYVVDKDNKNLNYIELKSQKEVQRVSPGSYSSQGTYDILLPKGAYKLVFSREEGGKGVNEIEILDTNTKNEIKNISISNKNYRQELTWEKSDNITKTLIYYDNKYVGYTTTNTFDSYVIPTNNTGKKFKLIPINNENKLNEIYEFDSITPKITFSSNVQNKDTEKLLFSKKGDSAVGVGEVTWDQDLIGKTLSVKLSGYSLYLKDIDNKKIPFLNAATGEQVSGLSAGSYSSTNTFNIIIPENAKSISFSREEGGYGVRDIYVLEEDKSNELSKIESWIVGHKSYITWQGNSKNVSIYYDNVYVGKSSNNSFSYTPPSNNLGKEFKLVPINSNNISSKIYAFTSIMPECVFATNATNKINESLLFDDNDSTISSASSLTWDTDLTGRTLRILLVGYGMYMYDENNVRINFINTATGKSVSGISAGSYGSSYDAKIIIPEKAKKITFYRNEGGYGIKTIQLFD